MCMPLVYFRFPDTGFRVLSKGVVHPAPSRRWMGVPRNTVGRSSHPSDRDRNPSGKCFFVVLKIHIGEL